MANGSTVIYGEGGRDLVDDDGRTRVSGDDVTGCCCDDELRVQAYDCENGTPLNQWWPASMVGSSTTVYYTGEDCVTYPDPPQVPPPDAILRADPLTAETDCAACQANHPTPCDDCPVPMKAVAALTVSFTYIGYTDFTKTVEAFRCRATVTVPQVVAGGCDWTVNSETICPDPLDPFHAPQAVIDIDVQWEFNTPCPPQLGRWRVTFQEVLTKTRNWGLTPYGGWGNYHGGGTFDIDDVVVS